MDYIVQFQLNIFTLIILFILFIIIKMRNEIFSYGRRLLKLIIIMTSIGLVMEPLTWIFDGKRFTGAFFLEYSTNFILFLLSPIIGGLMLCYMDYKIFGDRMRIRKRFFYMHAALFTLFLLLVNIFTPIYFSIHPISNTYKVESLHFIHYIIISMIYLFMLIFVIKHRKKTQKKVIVIFTIFFLIPILAMFIQIINIRLYFAWSSISIGLLMTYVFLESTSGERDFLTKLYTRYSYETYVKHLVEEHKPFGALLIDLDRFKEVNDTFGHHQGDRLLIEFGEVLQKVFYREILISRLAGDEFIIVIENSHDQINELINRLKDQCSHHAFEHLNKLSFSYGYQMFTQDMTLDILYQQIDKKMYVMKSR